MELAGLFTVALLIVANGSMIFFVVINGKVFCNYSFAFSWSLAITNTVWFAMCLAFKHGRINFFVPVQEEMSAKVLHRQAALNGFLWSSNYVCLLLANSFVPGLIQVVINEANLVIVFLGSMLFMGNRYYAAQWICFALVLLGGLLPLADEKSDGSSTLEVQWFFLYVIGAWAIGLANLVTENVMRNLHMYREGSVTASLSLSFTPQTRIDLVPVSQFLALSNFYGIFWVLALSWVPWLGQGDAWWGYFTGGMACTWAGQCNTDDTKTCASHGHSNDVMIGISTFWIVLFLNFVCCGVAALIQRQQDVVYVTVAYSVAPVLSMVLFLLPLSRFDDPVTPIGVIANLIALVGGISYKAFTHIWEPKPVRTSWMTKRFKFESPDAKKAIEILPTF